MKMISTSLMVLALVAGVSAHASDVIGIFGKITKVELIPDDKEPTEMKAYGNFALADLENRRYAPGVTGYMHFKLNPDHKTQTRNEWYDFRKVAALNAEGTGPHCIGFGVRRDPVNFEKAHFNGTVRKEGVKATPADVYPIVQGAAKVGPNHLECKKL